MRVYSSTPRFPEDVKGLCLYDVKSVNGKVPGQIVGGKHPFKPKSSSDFEEVPDWALPIAYSPFTLDIPAKSRPRHRKVPAAHVGQVVLFGSPDGLVQAAVAVPVRKQVESLLSAAADVVFRFRAPEVFEYPVVTEVPELPPQSEYPEFFEAIVSRAIVVATNQTRDFI